MAFIDKLVKKLEKFDSVQLGEKNPLISEDVWISTGSPDLDYNLGTLGIKKGLIELAGTSTAGKTTLGLSMVRNFLNKYPEAICVFMLSEERINEDYVKRIGVDSSRVFKVKSKFVEDLIFKTQLHINEIDDLWHSEKLPGKPKIILFWDSIGATLSRAELETYQENVKAYNSAVDKGSVFKIKHAKMAAFAGAAMVHIKNIFSQLYEKDIIMICVNHLKDDIGNPQGGKTSAGGSWRNFFCWLRLELTVDSLATSKMKIDEEKWGQITNIKVIKNDFGSYKKSKLKICIGYGLTLNDEDIEFAVKKNILKKEGESKYSFLNGKLSWKSPRTFFQLYRDENKLLKVLHNKITAARHKQVLEEKNLTQDEEE